jgi:hypothetical protein
LAPAAAGLRRSPAIDQEARWNANPSSASRPCAACLILRGGRLPRGLGWMALVAGALLVYVYIGRLTILDPKSGALLPFAVLSGFVVNPLWYAWLGVSMLRPVR